MGLQEVATTLLLFKADTSELRAAMKEATGLEKEALRATLDGVEARNKSLTSWAAKLTTVNSALGVATKAVQFMASSVNALDEVLDLTGASSKYNLDGLRSASQGLKTDMELLRLAAAAQNTTFSLTQKQLENATAAMRGFEESGYDGAIVQEKVKDAITRGSIKPLKELGINLDIAKGKTAAFNQLMEVLAEKSIAGREATDGQADAMKRAGVVWQNAMMQIKVAIGEIVVALAPLLDALGRVVGLVADVVHHANEGLGRIADGASIFGGDGPSIFAIGGDGGAAASGASTAATRDQEARFAALQALQEERRAREAEQWEQF